jgi:nucleotide-binding universal stress UspA family protein
MKKIIIPFAGDHFSKGAFLFAKKLDQIKPILLTGAFLPAVDYARFFFFPTAFAAPAYLPLFRHKQQEDENAIDEFTKACERNRIEYRVHHDLYESSIPGLKKEGRFSDLMIIGSESFYKDGIQYGSNEYLKGALHNTECPVIIVPENYNFPSQIVLAYDGSQSSVFAIKQFAYLLPELCNLKTILLYAGNQNQDIPEQVQIEELVARHYPDLTLTRLVAGNKANLSDLFDQYDKSIIVSGSFGRTGISELFNKSFIIDIIKNYKTPVFIAHK